MKMVRAAKSGFQKVSAPSVRYFKERTGETVQTIRQLVELESPSDVKQAVDRLGTILAGRFEELDGKVTVHRAEKYGNHLQVDFAGAQNYRIACQKIFRGARARTCLRIAWRSQDLAQGRGRVHDPRYRQGRPFRARLR